MKIIFYLIIVSSFNIFSQTDPDNYIKAIIILDSNKVLVEERGRQIAILNSVEDGYYFENIFYDNLTGNISLTENKTLNADSWLYKSSVWDFKNDKKYNLLAGTSSEGEDYHIALFLNYNPDKKIGLVKHYGWEWLWVTKYDNGQEEEMDGTDEFDVVNVLAILNENETLVEAYLLGEDPSFYTYLWDNKSLTAVEPASLGNYSLEILKTTGTNILYLNSFPFPDEVSYEDIIWSPDGKTLVYTITNLGYKDLYFYVLEETKEYKIAEGHSAYSIIWK